MRELVAVLTLVGSACFVVATFAPSITIALFGTQYVESGKLLRILAVAAFGQVCLDLLNSILVTMGGRREYAWLSAIAAALSLAAIVPLTVAFDATGTAVGLSLAYCAATLAGAIKVRRLARKMSHAKVPAL